MFGKTKDVIDSNLDGPSIDDFFGDEEAADHSAQIGVLRDRVKQAEAQINSQFTSMAAYAQIAQEQVELVRAESKSENERSESRLTQLIERERSDRMVNTGQTPGTTGVSSDIEARLNTLEQSVEAIKVGVSDCLSRQKALADAITALFEPKAATLPAPVLDGPIGGLAMHD